MEYKFVDGAVVLSEPPRRLKKLTATKFASVLGLNKWSTPFQQWSEITHAWNKPYEDNQYTNAGKIIEPLIIDYLKKRYFLNIKSPAEVFGADYFEKTHGDFYPDEPVFGGMWDAIGDDVIVEIKTTKRAEDWVNEVPIYYLLQACLYAYLSNKSEIYMVCSFLKDEDYEHPERFIPSMTNTIVRPFKTFELFPFFKEQYMEPALKWWSEYVETGISPKFDEKLDAEYLAGLRTSIIDTPEKLIETLKAIEEDQRAVDELDAQKKEAETRLKKNKEKLKKYMVDRFREGDNRAVMHGMNYVITVSKTQKKDVDKKALETDGLLNKYLTNKTEYRLTVAKRKEEQK